MAAGATIASDSNDSFPNMTSLIGGGPLSEQQLSAISEEDELRLLNYPSKREDLSTAIPLTVIFALLLVTGCIGNICTAIVIARPKNKYMHTATNYYLFSLAMSDLLFLVLGLPQEMYTLWHRYPYAFGEFFCIIRGYLSEASTYASILTISAFTVERYVAICHPLWAHTMSQLPRAVTSIVIIWCLAAVCAVPPAAELGIVTQRGPLTNRTLQQTAQCVTKRPIYENMFVVSAIVFFIVPMAIVTVLYILIAIELRRSSRMNNAISKQTSSHLYSQLSITTSNNNNNNNNNNSLMQSQLARQHHSQKHHHQHHHQHRHHHHHCNHHDHQHNNHQHNQQLNCKSFQSGHQHQQQLHSSRRSNAASSKKSVIRMLVAVVVSFFICWVPFHAQRLLASYLVKGENQNQLLLDIYLKLTYISGVMYYLSSTINPLLYQLMSAKFRLAFKETFKCSLFKCAIFRRASTATTATATVGLNHSPTNSIRNEPHLHQHQHQHQPACACPFASQSVRAGFVSVSASRAVTPSALQQQKQRLSESCADLQVSQALEQPADGQQQALIGEYCACCCCCCQLAALYQQPGAALSKGVLGRFKGQLNASLTSLLKFSLLSDSQENRQAGGPKCACCPIAASQSSCPLQSGRQHKVGADLEANQAHSRALQPEMGNFAGESRSCTSLVHGPGENNPPQDRQATPTGRPSKNCSGALFADEQASRRRLCDNLIKSAGNLGLLEESAAPNLQTNFPAHHTMLKFIRSPTPTSMNGAAQLLPSLTRLSSREEEDDDDQSLSNDIRLAQMTPPQSERRHLTNSARNKMGALIGPGQRDYCRQNEESDPLMTASLGGGGGEASSNDATSGTQSSTGSSPDQLGTMSQSTNRTRTLSTSSSSSLALLASGQSRDAKLAGQDLDGGQAFLSRSTRKRLTLSNSISGKPTAMDSHRYQRRSSWQQNLQAPSADSPLVAEKVEVVVHSAEARNDLPKIANVLEPATLLNGSEKPRQVPGSEPSNLTMSPARDSSRIKVESPEILIKCQTSEGAERLEHDCLATEDRKSALLNINKIEV